MFLLSILSVFCSIFPTRFVIVQLFLSFISISNFEMRNFRFVVLETLPYIELAILECFELCVTTHDVHAHYMYDLACNEPWNFWPFSGCVLVLFDDYFSTHRYQNALPFNL